MQKDQERRGRSHRGGGDREGGGYEGTEGRGVPGCSYPVMKEIRLEGWWLRGRVGWGVMDEGGCGGGCGEEIVKGCVWLIDWDVLDVLDCAIVAVTRFANRCCG